MFGICVGSVFVFAFGEIFTVPLFEPRHLCRGDDARHPIVEARLRAFWPLWLQPWRSRVVLFVECCSSASHPRLKPGSGKPRKRGSTHFLRDLDPVLKHGAISMKPEEHGAISMRPEEHGAAKTKPERHGVRQQPILQSAKGLTKNKARSARADRACSLSDRIW